MASQLEYEYAQESSQHFNETLEQYNDRIENQKIAASALRSKCKYAVSPAGIYKMDPEKNKRRLKSGILYVIYSRDGKFVKFANPQDELNAFDPKLLEGFRNAKYRTW